MRPHELHDLSRETLIERARSHGVVRPEVLTQVELIDEIVKYATPPSRRAKVRGWLGRARDLVARVMERGLHLPDAARLFLGPPPEGSLPEPPAPLPTVTLAEIYAAQGYFAKAVTVLDEVLATEPNHVEAATLRDRFVAAEIEGPRSSTSMKGHELADEDAAGSDETGAAESELEVASPEPEAGIVADLSPPAEPTEELAKPTRAKSASYTGRDEVVALATDPHTAYVYWELRPLRFAQLRAAYPRGKMVLRVLSVALAQDLVKSSTRDLSIDALAGDVFLRGLKSGSEVRLCLGWLSDATFMPLVVGTALQMPFEHIGSGRDSRAGLGSEGGGMSAAAAGFARAAAGRTVAWVELDPGFLSLAGATGASDLYRNAVR